MSTHKHFDKICCVILALTLILTVFFMNAECFGIQKASSVMGYEKKLFDTSKVHTIDIIMDDWDEFTENCKSEEYYNCTVVIDNDAYKNVAIRGKGNTSLTQVESYGNNRYSFKIEFDRYDSANTYYGLDKLCLNNIIQDNTYMKDYLTYQMMNQMGVAAPLCSYVYITANGEDWGLYLAVEGVEESFLKRNYGSDYGELYKPDSMSMGGGRGNGEKFDMSGFENNSKTNSKAQSDNSSGTQSANSNQDEKKPDNMMGDAVGKMSNGSDDVLLKYIDDDYDSYSNIFDNAKTNVSDADKKRLINALKKLSNKEDLDSTVDVNAVIRYFTVHNFVLNFDSYTGSMIHNYYLYEDDGQLQMIPWDYNLAFGGFQSAKDAKSLVNYPIDSPVSGGNVEDRPMIAWIFANEEYTELYHKCFSEFITEYFDSGYFEKMIDSVNSLISPYVEKDPTKFCTYDEFSTGIKTLKQFCLLRAQSVSKQLDGTIGSTSDTQKSETLIDAGDIKISDMGSMNASMGGEKKDEADADAQSVNGNSNGSDKNNSNNNNGNSNGGGNGIQQPPSFNTNGNNSAPQMPNGQSRGGNPPNVANGDSNNSAQGGDNGQSQGGNPPNVANGDNNNSAQGGDSGQSQGGNPPNVANGDNNNSAQGGDSGQSQGSDPPNVANGDNNNSAQGGDSGQSQGGNPPNVANGDKNQARTQTNISAVDWIIGGISVIILAFGLGFALIYKRRK